MLFKLLIYSMYLLRVFSLDFINLTIFCKKFILYLYLEQNKVISLQV